jgi:hypothetical protein
MEQRSDYSLDQATLARPATAPAVGGEHGSSSAAGTQGARRATMLMSSTSFKGNIWGLNETDKKKEAGDNVGTLGADKKVKFTVKASKSMIARPGTRYTSISLSPSLSLSLSFFLFLSLSLSFFLFLSFRPVAAP